MIAANTQRPNISPKQQTALGIKKKDLKQNYVSHTKKYNFWIKFRFVFYTHETCRNNPLTATTTTTTVAKVENPIRQRGNAVAATAIIAPIWTRSNDLHCYRLLAIELHSYIYAK